MREPRPRDVTSSRQHWLVFDVSTHTAILEALAAVTGQSPSDLEAAFVKAREETDQRRAEDADTSAFFDHLKTRLGLAPAVDPGLASALSAALASARGTEDSSLTPDDLAAWDRVLRHTAEHIPTLDRDSVVIPPFPEHQTRMWETLLRLDELGHPWVLVGGQMTMLHCLENGFARSRPTDDGDLVVGVWTRRDALLGTSRYLRANGFNEVKTTDGYGYRFERDNAAIDVLLPAGLDRQREYPTTTSGRRGLTADGGNQALTRAERVPVTVASLSGHIRRPNLLGAIVVKAHAYVADSRDKGRHAEDILALAAIALQDPRAALRHARPHDRVPVRRFLRDKKPTDEVFRRANDPEAIFRILARLADL